MRKSAKFSKQYAAVSEWERAVESWKRLAAADPSLAWLLARAERRLAEERAALAEAAS